MDRLKQFEKLLDELVLVNDAKASFTKLFRQGCLLLEYDDEEAARKFDTSRPNVNRWRHGKVVPPAAPLVLKFLRELVEKKINTLKRLENSGSYAKSAMAAKGR